MPIAVDRLTGALLPAVTMAWNPDTVITYHLGVGAGVPPTDDGELAYTLERHLKVLPSFAVVPAFPALSALSQLDGFDIDQAALLHGEQEIELYAPIRVADEVVTTGRVARILDKGSGALVTVETVSRRTEDGERCFTNRFSCFIRGEGGFGERDIGQRVPDHPPQDAPQYPPRPPDVEVDRATLPQQALLYRLSGDRNPVHADPAHARRAGFDRPILHGLCTFGIACKAVVDEVLGGDVGAVRGYRARFAGAVYPGETLGIRMWRAGDLVHIAAHGRERGNPVLSKAILDLREAA
jgi:acyl dehydratase